MVLLKLQKVGGNLDPFVGNVALPIAFSSG